MGFFVVIFVVFPVGCTLKAQAFKALDNYFEETEGFDFPVIFFILICFSPTSPLLFLSGNVKGGFNIFFNSEQS